MFGLSTTFFKKNHFSPLQIIPGDFLTSKTLIFNLFPIFTQNLQNSGPHHSFLESIYGNKGVDDETWTQMGMLWISVWKMVMQSVTAYGKKGYGVR